MYISPYIYDVLSASSVGDATGKRIYPLAAPASTDMPFITYRTVESRNSGSKDGMMRDINVELAIVGKSNKEMHIIAEDVILAIEGDEANANAIGLDCPMFEQMVEEYDPQLDAYVLRVSFSYKGNPNL